MYISKILPISLKLTKLCPISNYSFQKSANLSISILSFFNFSQTYQALSIIQSIQDPFILSQTYQALSNISNLPKSVQYLTTLSRILSISHQSNLPIGPYPAKIFQSYYISIQNSFKLSISIQNWFRLSRTTDLSYIELPNIELPSYLISSYRATELPNTELPSYLISSYLIKKPNYLSKKPYQSYPS